MKKNLLTFCAFFCVSVCSFSAQATEEDCCLLREVNGQVYKSSETILCRDTYWTWKCRKCGTTNVQEANKCSNCGAAR